MRLCGHRRSRGRDDEDGGVEGEAGRPASCELTERRGRWRRSPWTARRGEGSSVATGTAGGGDGGARAREGERTRGGERHGRELEGVGEVAWRRGEGPERRGGSQAGWRWPHCGARALGTRPSFWQRRKTTGKEAVVGWAGHLGRQVGCRGKSR